MERGDHAGAIAQLEALVKQDPDKPEVHLLLLSAYRSKGDIQATTRQARQAVGNFPGHLQSQLEAGMDLQTVGEFELAEQALRRAVALSKDNPADRRKARFNLATVLVKLGRDDQAVPLLKEVVEADPGEVGGPGGVGRTATCGRAPTNQPSRFCGKPPIGTPGTSGLNCYWARRSPGWAATRRPAGTSRPFRTWRPSQRRRASRGRPASPPSGSAFAIRLGFSDS